MPVRPVSWPVSWPVPWPVSWVILALLLGTAAALWGWGRLRRTRARRRALRRLRGLERDWRRAGDAAYLLAGISALVRDTAIATARRPGVAGLSGRAWLVHLDETGDTRAFTVGAGRALRHGPYCRAEDLGEELDVPALLAAVEAWLRRQEDARP